MEDVGLIIIKAINGIMDILNTTLFDGYYMGFHAHITLINVILYPIAVLIMFRIMKYMLDK